MKYVEFENISDIPLEETLEVEIYPFGSLRETAQPYAEDEFGEELLAFGKKMLNTMYVDNGIGLAANQVNHLKRIFVMDVTEDRSNQYIFINPEIIASEGEACIEEGCLSVPDVTAPVKRKATVTVKYFDPMGQEHEETFTELAAICVQHEIDHLNGIMFFDHISPIAREKAMKKLKKWIKANKGK